MENNPLKPIEKGGINFTRRGATLKKILSAKRGAASTIFNKFGMSRPRIKPVTSRSPERLSYPGQDFCSWHVKLKKNQSPYL